MTRPERQLKHLQEKIADKTNRAGKRGPGKRLKRYKKWAEKHAAVAAA